MAGVIAPITFLISLFSQNVAMYEVHNNRAWYNLGYLFGLAIVLAAAAAGRRPGGREGDALGKGL